MARSARRSNSCGPASGHASASPTLARTSRSWPSACTGRVSGVGDPGQHVGRLAGCAARAAAARTRRRRAGPPRRPARTHSRSRCPTTTSRASPTAWPSRSLIALKSSRSISGHAERAAGHPRQRLLGALLEQRPVGQVGQVVVVGAVGELLLVRCVHPAQQAAVLGQRGDLPDHHERGQADGGDRDREHVGAGVRGRSCSSSRRWPRPRGTARRRTIRRVRAGWAKRGARRCRSAAKATKSMVAGIEDLRAAEARVHLDQHREGAAADGADDRGGGQQPDGDPVQAAEPAHRDLDHGQRDDQAQHGDRDHRHGVPAAGARIRRLVRTVAYQAKIPAVMVSVRASRTNRTSPLLLGPFADREPQQRPEQHHHGDDVDRGGHRIVLLLSVPARAR